MKPVDQTVFGDRTGNCFAACVASVLELPLEGMPNFCGGPDITEDSWCPRFRAWLAERGLGCAFLGYSPEHGIAAVVGAGAYVIVGGDSPRGNFLHQVVYRGDELVHDPHPDRTGLLKIVDFTILFPLNPAGLC